MALTAVKPLPAEFKIITILKGLFFKLPPLVQDIAKRTVRSFVGVFTLALLSPVGPHVLVNASTIQKAAGAAFAAAASVFLGLIGAAFGNHKTATFGSGPTA